MLKKYTVNVGTIDYSSGQKKSIDLPRDGVVLEYRLRCQYTVTNGGSAAVGPFFQGLARIFRQIDIRLNGRDTVVSHRGEHLAARARYEYGVPSDGMDDTVVLTGSAATVYDVTIPIPRLLPRSATPLLCGDDLRRVNDAVLEITWANSDCSQLYTTPNSAAISAVTCWLEVDYMVDVDPARTFLTRQLHTLTRDFTASNEEFSITVDTGTGLQIRSIAEAMTVANVGSDAPIDRVALRAGTQHFFNRISESVRAANRQNFGLENPLTGYYFFATEVAGDFGFNINTSKDVMKSDLVLVQDVTFTSGTHTCELSIEAIRPPRLTA